VRFGGFGTFPTVYEGKSISRDFPGNDTLFTAFPGKWESLLGTSPLLPLIPFLLSMRNERKEWPRN
jgi:hypothetical protein